MFKSSSAPRFHKHETLGREEHNVVFAQVTSTDTVAETMQLIWDLVGTVETEEERISFKTAISVLSPLLWSNMSVGISTMV